MTNLKKSITRAFLEFIEVTFVGASVAILVFIFVGQLLIITGDSMEPNFHDGEQLIVEKITKKLKPFERGEVIIIKHPDNESILVIKRIIGMPQEKVEFTEGQVYINDELLDESSYLSSGTKTTGKNFIHSDEEIEVPKGQYLVLGDNRENSADSRIWGFVTEDEIVGRSFLVYFPFDNIRLAQ